MRYALQLIVTGSIGHVFAGIPSVYVTTINLLDAAGTGNSKGNPGKRKKVNR